MPGAVSISGLVSHAFTPQFVHRDEGLPHTKATSQTLTNDIPGLICLHAFLVTAKTILAESCCVSQMLEEYLDPGNVGSFESVSMTEMCFIRQLRKIDLRDLLAFRNETCGVLLLEHLTWHPACGDEYPGHDSASEHLL